MSYYFARRPWRDSAGSPPNGALSAVAGLVLFVVASCATSEPQSRDPPAPEPKRPAITVIRSRTFWFDWNREVKAAEPEIERSIGEAIRRQLPELRYISREQFARAVFPEFTPEAAPLQLKSMRVLLKSPDFRERIEPLNLRYIVYVCGRTEIEAEHKWIYVMVYPYWGYVGRSKWDKETMLRAVLFDLQHPAAAKRATEFEEGTSWVAGVWPVVLGPQADTAGEARKELGEQLVQIIKKARETEAKQ
jgi:hypothetical protein